MRALQWIFVFVLVIGFVYVPTAGAQGKEQTFTSADGLLTFEYPAGWTAEETEPNTYSVSSDILIQIFTTPAVDEFMLNWGLDSSGGANVVGNLMSSRLPEDTQGRSQEFIPLDDGRQLCLYYHSDPDSGDDLWLLTLEAPDSGAVLLMLMMAHPDEATDFRDTFLSIAESIRYTPPEEVPTGSVVWQHEFPVNQTDPLSFSGLGGIDTSEDYILYVANPTNGIFSFNPDGEFMAQLDPFDDDVSINDVAVAADGTLYALDGVTGIIYHLDPQDGTILDTLADSSGVERSWRNIEITVDGLFVLEYSDEQITGVQIRDASNIVQAEIDISTNRTFPGPVYIDLGPDGNVYTMDLVGQMISYDLDGNVVRDYGLLMTAANTIALQIGPDGSIFFAADWGGLWYYDSESKYQGDLAQTPPETEVTDGTYYEPGGLVRLPDGDLVLVDRLGDTVVMTRFRFDQADQPNAGAELPELTDTFTSEDGTLTFLYPAGWSAIEAQAGMVSLITDPAILGTQNYGPDDMMLMINWFSLADSNTSFAPTTELTPLGIAGELVATFEAQAGTDFSEPEEITINGHAAAQFSGEVAPTSMYVLVLDVGNDEICFILLNTRSDQLERFTPLTTSIVESITYTP